MAISASTKHCVLIYILVLAFKFGKAHDLGAAEVVANEYLPKAEDEGEKEQHDDHQTGTIGTSPAYIVNKALECFNDEYIYSSCDEAHRLTQTGELNVPPEYTDEYCSGPCLYETEYVLDCIDGILKDFTFYNRATIVDVRETIESGCSHGPKRGNFDVAKHIHEADDAASSNKVFNSFVLMGLIVGWLLLI